MKDPLKRALGAKQVQRTKSASKSVTEKLRLVEEMRQRNAPLKALRDSSGHPKSRSTPSR